ncbi:MAG: PHP domain-containing protein [Candidatus Krumholzibacteriia bacterium]
MNGLVDLHSHSDQSDGSLTPEQLVDHAVAAGVSVLALTDHDTTAGHARFRAHARACGLVPVCGVEVSCTWDVKGGQCHLLGLGVAAGHPALEAALTEIRGGRDRRNARMVEKLNALGYPVTLAEIEAVAGGEVVARPHFARVLVERGLVESYQAVFDTLLARGAPAYVDRFRLSPADAAELVVAAGGRPVIAHPAFLGLAGADLAAFLRGLLPHGLWGLETWYTGFSNAQITEFKALADELGLVATMGSDFHGAPKPGVIIGHRAPGVPLPGPCPPDLLADAV